MKSERERKLSGIDSILCPHSSLRLPRGALASDARSIDVLGSTRPACTEVFAGYVNLSSTVSIRHSSVFMQDLQMATQIVDKAFDALFGRCLDAVRHKLR